MKVTYTELLHCFTMALLLITLPVKAIDGNGTVLTRNFRDIHNCSITIRCSPGSALNRFQPDNTFGAGVDGLDRGEVDKTYSPDNLRAMLSAGFKPLSYRLRTELGVEAWHWNPEGVWSDAAHNQGYWTSSSTAKSPIQTSYGFLLPRRGDTIDQANNTGYSRILDDDPQSFWKSNPYLDQHFTGDDNSLHPQWIVLDLGKAHSIDAMRVLWGTPYALEFKVEYCIDDNPTRIFDSSRTRWHLFSGGAVNNGAGGSQYINLSGSPVNARFVRIMLTRSSGFAPPGSKDIRDRLGFAVREMYLGVSKHDGSDSIQDCLKHGKSVHDQSTVYVSSTDPWHRAIDIDEHTEQPGFDRVLASGLTNGINVLTPVATLYDTPDNAAQMIKYLKRIHFPVKQIEVGEEPDGQNIMPEDYAALYLQYANALHRVDPSLKLGGPGLQTSVEGYETWEDATGNSSWLNRFTGYLVNRHRLKDFSFFSFEWYPFDDIHSAPKIEKASTLLSKMYRQFVDAGVPRAIPWIITEYGYSSSACRAEVEMPGAIVNTECAAQFLSLGGTSTYYYGYEPNSLMNEADNTTPGDASWGNLMLFLSDEAGHIKAPTAAFYTARLITPEWVQPGALVHQLFAADTNIRNDSGEELVSAFPVMLPAVKGEERWSLLVLNKDPAQVVRLAIHVADGAATDTAQGPFETVQYGPDQYTWHANGATGFASPNDPPVHRTVNTSSDILLPPYSITIVKFNRIR